MTPRLRSRTSTTSSAAALSDICITLSLQLSLYPASHKHTRKSFLPLLGFACEQLRLLALPSSTRLRSNFRSANSAKGLSDQEDRRVCIDVGKSADLRSTLSEQRNTSEKLRSLALLFLRNRSMNDSSKIYSLNGPGLGFMLSCKLKDSNQEGIMRWSA